MTEGTGFLGSAKFRKFFADTGLNILLAAASCICFGVFLYNAATYSDDSAYRSAIGAVAQGAPDQKRLGAPSFSRAKTGDSVYFRDMIWVGPGEQVDIGFSDNTVLTLFENTFVVLLKRPGLAEDAVLVQLLEGNVEVKKVSPSSHVVVQTYEEELLLREFQKIAAKSVPEKSPSRGEIKGIYPVDGSLLYLVQAEAVTLTFAWPERVRGVLVIRETGGGEIMRREVGEMNAAPVRLAVGKAYEWQVLVNGSAVYGPSGFEIKPFSTEALERKMDPTSNRVIEIIGNKREN